MPTAAERAILEYVIETGYLVVRLKKLAEKVLAGEIDVQHQAASSQCPTKGRQSLAFS